MTLVVLHTLNYRVEHGHEPKRDEFGQWGFFFNAGPSGLWWITDTYAAARLDASDRYRQRDEQPPHGSTRSAAI